MKLKKKLSSLSYTLKLANSSRRRIESLYNRKLLKRSDLHQIYKGLYINSIVAFELFIEEVFVGLLCKKYSIRNAKCNINFNSYQLCKDVIGGGKNKYIDWLPYERTINLANIYFKNGLPFTNISPTDRDNLALLIKMRNYMAHGSEVAKKAYLRQLAHRMTTVPLAYENPVTFLRDFYSYPSQTYYEQLLANVVIIAKNISS